MENIISFTFKEMTVEDMRKVYRKLLGKISIDRFLYIVATINNKSNDLDEHWRQSVTLLEIYTINEVMLNGDECEWVKLSDSLANLFLDMYKQALTGSYSIHGISAEVIKEVEDFKFIIDGSSLVW